MTDIIVIDHDPANEQFLINMLKQQGYAVVAAQDGETGLKLATELHPGVVICNWSLPGNINGLKICQTLKQSPALSATYLLALISRQSIKDRVRCLDMGADDWLSTPIDSNELCARVRAGLRLHYMARNLQQQKLRLEAELFEAESYVRSLLPADQEGKVPIQARFYPSQQLGGDCYDYYWLDPDYLVMYLLDVSGHGLGSALLSTSVLNVLRSQSLPDVSFYRPEKVLQALNETFQMSAQNEKYFTIWYGVLNCANRQLLYASAGHPPAVLVSNHHSYRPKVQRLRTPGMPIGMLPEANYRWSRCELPPSSTLYLFSDGIYEILQGGELCLGLDAFVDILASTKAHGSIDDILETVTQKRLGTSVTDDMSLVTLTLV